jgi:type IV secretory pathway VirB4 component
LTALNDNFNDDHDELSRHLCYGPLVAPGTILTTEDNALLAAIEYGGHDHTTMDYDRRLEITDRVGDMIAPLDGGWSISWEWQRRRDTGYPDQQGNNTVPLFLDGQRRDRLNNSQFKSRYYIGFSFTPEQVAQRAVARWFTNAPTSRGALVSQYLPPFTRIVDDLASGIGNAVGQAKRLDSDELATMLWNCISPEPHPGLEVPHLPGFPISKMLTPFGVVPDVGGEPKLTNGGKTYHLRVLGVLTFRTRNTHPGWLDALESLPLEFRLNARFLCMSSHTASKVFKSLWRQHDDAAYDVRSIIAARFGFMEHKRDAVGEVEAADAAAARIEAETSGARSGWMTLTIVTWADTAAEADSNVSRIKEVMQQAKIAVVGPRVAMEQKMQFSAPRQ